MSRPAAALVFCALHGNAASPSVGIHPPSRKRSVRAQAHRARVGKRGGVCLPTHPGRWKANGRGVCEPTWVRQLSQRAKSSTPFRNRTPRRLRPTLARQRLCALARKRWLCVSRQTRPCLRPAGAFPWHANAERTDSHLSNENRTACTREPSQDERMDKPRCSLSRVRGPCIPAKAKAPCHQGRPHADRRQHISVGRAPRSASGDHVGLQQLRRKGVRGLPVAKRERAAAPPGRPAR